MKKQPINLLLDLEKETVNVPEFSMDMMIEDSQVELTLEESSTKEFVKGYNTGYEEGYLSSFAETYRETAEHSFSDITQQWLDSEQTFLSAEQTKTIKEKILNMPKVEVREPLTKPTENRNISELEEKGEETGYEIGADNGYYDAIEQAYDAGKYYWLDCFSASLRNDSSISQENRIKAINSMLPADMHYSEKEMEGETNLDYSPADV